MVAIANLGKSLEATVDQQTKELLGADLLVHTREPWTDAQNEFLKTLPAEVSDQVVFSSMVYFPKNDGARMAQLGGLSGKFPYYGTAETDPPTAWAKFHNGDGALVEETLLQQFGVSLGDPIKIGELTVPVIGSLKKMPGDNEFFAGIAPRVYLPYTLVEKTGLLGESSLARYRRYYKFDSAEELAKAERGLEARRPDLQLRFDTVEERKDDLGDALENLYRFLNLGAFVSLLLGVIGIATCMQVYVRQRLDSIAVLRFLGATEGHAFTIYLLQAAGLAVFGVICGTILGVVAARVLPIILQDLIPVEVTVAIEPLQILRAAATGFALCLLFALPPLLKIRRIPPIAVLRREFEGRRPDPVFYAFIIIIAASVTLFAISQTERLHQGLWFAGGLAGALVVLALFGKLILVTAKKLGVAKWPFTWRYALGSLHRPQNRTTLLVVALGLGTFLLLALFLIQYSLVQEITPSDQSGKPNAVLFDIQPDQNEGVLNILREEKMPILGVSPVITMRIASINGTTQEELVKNQRRSRWPLQREYRSTYRDHLASSEELTAGNFVKTVEPGVSPVPISMEEGIANELEVKLGDKITFDVQGVPIECQITSLRKVDWRRVQANFFVVFPKGALDEAPGFFIVTTRVKDSGQSGAMQRAIVKKYPNVSTIDFTMILRLLEEVVEKISLGIRFIGGLTLLTGIILLITAILHSQAQRQKEAVLLRTLGASSTQILKIQAAEFLLLGLVAGTTGVLLSMAAHWGLATFFFKIPFSVPWLHLGAAIIINVLLTTITGLLATLPILKHPPLQVLRSEN